MSSEKPASYGTNHLDPPALRIASFPLDMLFKRVVLIPLAIYLAQADISHPLVDRKALVGRTALAGTIPASLFPRLGVLGGIASLLRKGATDYLDQSSSVSELPRTVWDARWGSVFSCANGAASDILTQHAVRTAVDIPIPTDLGELVPEYIDQETQAEVPEERGAAVIASEVRSAVKDGARGPRVRRPQTLYIIDCSIDEKRRQAHAFRASPQAAMWETVVEAAVLLALVGTTAAVILLGLYGTAAALLVSTIFRVSRLLIQVERPPGYLASNEPDQNDACMLVAIHQNADTWYLYTGSRGVVDWLLNKSMISKVTSRGGGDNDDTNAATVETTALLLHALAVLQLGAMTYVAAQKGWDAFGLLAIVLCASLLDHVLYSDGRLAQRWLRAEHVTMKAYACQFSGRVPMIGVIQTRRKAATGGSPTSWMDQIIAPSERRYVWLRKLRRSASASSVTAEEAAAAAAAEGQTGQRPFWVAEDGQATTEKEKNDRIWVQNNFVLTRAAAEAIDTHTGGCLL
ncbi:hypothetical protein NHJ13051_001901 [Beauveria bassiana]